MSNNLEKKLINNISENIENVEKSMSKNDYNISLIASRQAMENMVKYLCHKFNFDYNNSLVENIHKLRRKKIISEKTYYNFNYIRTIGNKAVHENYASAADAAKVHSLIMQELVLFKNGHYDKKSALSRADIIKLIAPLIAILLLCIIIIFLQNTMHKKDVKNVDILEKPVVNTVNIEKPVEEEPQAETPLQYPQPIDYITLVNLNVRSSPSIEGDKLTSLPKGSDVSYIKDYDSEWAVINYNNSQAYVAKRYIKQK